MMSSTSRGRCLAVPEQKGHVIAHMRCLQVLARKQGKAVQVSKKGVRLAHNQWWHLREWSASCPETGHTLRWADDLFQQIKDKEDTETHPLERECRGMPNGAVVFGAGTKG
jgi:hypothetical protein